MTDLAAGGGDHGGGGQQSDARDQHKRGARWDVASDLSELALKLSDTHLQQPDLLDEQLHRLKDQRGYTGMWVGQHARDLLHAQARALGDHDAELARAAH